MSDSPDTPIRVFLSYSWDSDEHKERVLQLAQRLRRDGIDAVIDRFTTFPEKGWPRWMFDQVEESSFVLVVGSEIYSRRFAKREDTSKGLGATWEGAIITQEIYEAGARYRKFVPVIFNSDDAAHIPAPLRSASYFRVDRQDGYDALYRYLTGQPALVAAPLGPRRILESSTGVDEPAEVTIASPTTVKATRLPDLPVQSSQSLVTPIYDGGSTVRPSKRFRVAFSFAGEKRDFVANVAGILAKRFGENAILYDKYHEAEFARRDLGIYLPELYHNHADLVVVVICPNYDAKQWTGLEWTAIHDLLSHRKADEVMLCRFEHATVAGLYSTAGFIELDRKSPDQAATLVLHRLALNERRPSDYYTKDSPREHARSASITPNNLPRLLYFFGREAELKKIADAVAPDARGWGALIDGPGGIGKTSLAIRAAELVPHGRFQHIIFLSSKERELTADGQRALGHFVLPGYLDMLNAIARELDQPKLVESPEADRSDAILRALRGVDVLLVLDNLETLPEGDRDQLFAFLNHLPSGCSAIVTSRRRADATAVAVRLDKLDWSAARDLITVLAQDNERLRLSSDAERHALYEETGGNPLLIRWVAGQLGRGRCNGITAALAFLRSAPPSNDPLEFVFGDLLDNFTLNETKSLAALTHFTIPIEANFVAELAQINPAAAQGALSDLSTRALVLPDVEERRFALMPMVADFLRRKCPTVVSETGGRLEQHAYALIVQNGFDRWARFPVLDAAWPIVAPALPLIVAGANPQLQTVCDALRAFFESTNRLSEWLSLEQQAEERAAGERDFLNAGMRAYQAGRVHILREQAPGAFACADRAAVHWQAAQAGAGERAMVLRLRGLGFRLNNEFSAAITAFREAIDLFRGSAHWTESLGMVLNDLGDVERLCGEFDAAQRNYREGLNVARMTGNLESLAIFTGNLAALALAQGDWLNAEALSREALSFSEKIGRQELIALNCWQLAKALASQSRKPEALPYAVRAVEMFTKLASPGLEAARATLRECDV